MNVLTTLAICFISAILITLCIDLIEKLIHEEASLASLLGSSKAADKLIVLQKYRRSRKS